MTQLRSSLNPPVVVTTIIAVALGLVWGLGLLPTFGVATTAARPDPGTIEIDLWIDNGVPQPLTLVPGMRYRIDQIDISATDEQMFDDGLAGLRARPVFDQLDWTGLAVAFEDTAAGLDGIPFLREIYRDATWMTETHQFDVTPLDSDGAPLGATIELESRSDARFIQKDDFPIRRPVVVRDIRDALHSSEAWIQLRNAGSRSAVGKTFDATDDLTHIALAFETIGANFEFPVTLEPSPSFSYGFQIDLEIEGGQTHYQPGDVVHTRVTFRDGDGNRLHPPGVLPTYNEFLGGLESGLRYFDFYPSILFFKDKNKEGVLLAAMSGPRNRVRQTYTEVSFEQFSRPQQVVATVARDGYTCLWQLVPSADILFGGVQDPALWDLPVSDELDFEIPADAQSGDYFIVIKARRAYLSESSLVTTTVDFTVDAPASAAGSQGDFFERANQLPRFGSPIDHVMDAHHGSPPNPTRDDWVGRCEKCHQDGFELGSMLHSNEDLDTCAACHAPLAFEPDNMLAYRVHHLHNFSDRVPLDPLDCEACHIQPSSVLRGSLLVCLSCHETYHGEAEMYGLYMHCDDASCHTIHDF